MQWELKKGFLHSEYYFFKANQAILQPADCYLFEQLEGLLCQRGRGHPYQSVSCTEKPKLLFFYLKDHPEDIGLDLLQAA